MTEHETAALKALPKTQDGVTIYPGLKLWDSHGLRVTAVSVGKEWITAKHRDGWSTDGPANCFRFEKATKARK